MEMRQKKRIITEILRNAETTLASVKVARENEYCNLRVQRNLPAEFPFQLHEVLRVSVFPEGVHGHRVDGRQRFPWKPAISIQLLQ